jgi:RimJ/RimL family protein N-acetyltransferase
MPDLEIELGGGATLRSLQPEDAGALVALVAANRTRLARWFAWAGEDGAEDAAATATWIEERAADPRSLEPNGIFVDGALAGEASLWVDPEHDIGEFGSWVGEEFIGRGLATRAGQALLAAGFDDLGLHRVQARVGVENLRARALAKRLKMREEGVLRGAAKVGGGLYVDVVMYGLLVDEWRMSR